MAQDKDGALQRVSKALAHPLRVRILEQMGEGEASPNGLAQALDEPLGNISYHVKALLEFGAVELTKTEPRRGAVEHFYRRTGSVLPTADANTALDAITDVLGGGEGPAAKLKRVRSIVAGTGRKV